MASVNRFLDMDLSLLVKTTLAPEYINIKIISDEAEMSKRFDEIVDKIITQSDDKGDRLVAVYMILYIIFDAYVTANYYENIPASGMLVSCNIDGTGNKTRFLTQPGGRPTKEELLNRVKGLFEQSIEKKNKYPNIKNYITGEKDEKDETYELEGIKQEFKYNPFELKDIVTQLQGSIDIKYFTDVFNIEEKFQQAQKIGAAGAAGAVGAAAPAVANSNKGILSRLGIGGKGRKTHKRRGRGKSHKKRKLQNRKKTRKTRK